jgi:hypothetical protein
VAELARLNVDVLVVAGGEGWIRAAQNATKTIPIVMTGTGSDPVEEGLIKSLAHPGGNVTGITNLTKELGGKRLELLKETVRNSPTLPFSTIPRLRAVYERLKRISPRQRARWDRLFDPGRYVRQTTSSGYLPR